MINNKSPLAEEFWEHGKLAHCPIINFHSHPYDAYGLYFPCKTPEDMLEAMDKTNTMMTMFVSGEALLNPCAGSVKDVAAVRRYPDRYRAYRIIMSRHLDPARDLKDYEENQDAFIGFKTHGDCYNTPLSDPRHDPYWEYADRHKLLVLNHTWGTSANDGPEEVEKILQKYPNLVFLAAHCFHDKWEAGPELVKKYPNLYLELTAVLDNRGMLDMFVERCGSKQIVFGTDLPWFDTHYSIGSVLAAEMTDDQRRDILYRNGARLLSRFPWFPPLWKKHGGGESL